MSEAEMKATILVRDSIAEEFAEKLQAETDFENYIELLSEASQRFTVFVASYDTPCGSELFNEEIATKLKIALGTRYALHDKVRCSYVAVVDEGKLLVEHIDANQPIEITGQIDDNKINIYSMGYRMITPLRVNISINDENPVVSARGLHFVVFDKREKEILDYVAFDTYVPGLTKIYCQRNSGHYYRLFEKFILAHPGVTFLEVEHPRNSIYLVKNSVFDRFSKINNGILNEMDASIRQRYLDFPNFPLRGYANNIDELNELLDPQPSYIGTDGSRRFLDYHGKHVNIENGHRVTPGQPNEFKHRVWCVSGCDMYGVGVRDEGTISAFLQKLFNNKAKNHGFKVENYGYCMAVRQLGHGYNHANQLEETMAILKNIPITIGDVVISCIIPCKNKIEVDYVRGYGDLLWDHIHLTENGLRLVADKIFDNLEKNNFYLENANRKASNPDNNKLFSSDKSPSNDKTSTSSNKKAQAYGFTEEQMKSLEQYKEKLANFCIVKTGESHENQKIGSIVMNCNPFTLGHRYLIEQASRECDYLIVFVVQEDKSVFPFADRIELVKEGTKDLSNVGVIESGQFIISSLTFREYFNKSELQDRTIDSSTDVTLFAREIAPAANISIRFVGSEPFDRVTNQYNEMLKDLLPRYGIELKEMTRHEAEGEAISASRVRKLLETKDWDAIKTLVPTSTYEYLLNRFEVCTV
ncbi:MAG: adenylyltransferase/cytidyltransferase family protein [Clostridiales bacterium]|jgi:cytidyltransferase-like protein|nr:adenylyltransferase/cytidyltransferase family protein [Clostridiales bacterium]